MGNINKIIIENKIINWIIFLLFIGMYFPSSFFGVNKYIEIYFYIPLMIVLLFFIFKFKLFNNKKIFFFIGINLLLILFTVIKAAEFQRITWGALPPFFLFSLLICLNFKLENYFKKIITWFNIFIITQIILSWGIILQIDLIQKILLAFFDGNLLTFGLLNEMIVQLKPINTFLTHSIAGFYMFIFFVLNFYTFIFKNKIIYLIISFNFLFFLIFLNSSTSFYFFLISIGLIMFELFNLGNKKVLFFLIFIGCILVFFYYPTIINNYRFTNFDDYYTIRQSNVNGIATRYSKDSRFWFRENYEYIEANPFVGLGLNFNNKLFYTDNGYLLIYLRGSIYLFLLFYIGFINFLKRNIIGNKFFIISIIAYLLFELGYANLLNSRSLYFLPFLILYFNNLINFKKKYVQNN